MENYSWTYLQKYPKQTKRLLGIDYQQLKDLIELGKLLNQRKREEIEKSKVRINRAGGGNHPKLSEEKNRINADLLETSFKLSTLRVDV